MSLSSGLTTYDLKDRDIGDLLVLNWEETDPAKKRGLGIFYRAKLISQPALKEIAIKKHGSEANLATHLQRKRATLLAAHQQRVADYETAIAERQQLLNEGDTSAAAAVTMGPTKKKIPKSRPAIPAMLNGSGTPPFYQTFAIFRGGFLSVENGVVSHDKLVRCMLCVMMEKLRDDDCKARGDSFEFIDPGFMPPTVLDAHKEAAHYDREEEECFDGCADDGDSEGRCRICFNASAVWLNHEFGGL
ncbi:hypothetical protein B0H17DRAFT_535399 [Mycena rosella]|uniref:Uncharacterized protein n=1 Tax=Mycena rosella TaxID=1033263 RepID=A0AAD7BVI2_MYCRO|nr:hypothetical protein B0H17DRAFT_535399 [Mycena rosella]